MDPEETQIPEPPAPSAAREAGDRRIAHVNRWVLAGAIALTGAFAGLASQSVHGTSRKSSPKATEPAATPPADQDPGLAPPPAPPEADSGDAGATSGGS